MESSSLEIKKAGKNIGLSQEKMENSIDILDMGDDHNLIKKDVSPHYYEG